ARAAIYHLLSGYNRTPAADDLLRQGGEPRSAGHQAVSSGTDFLWLADQSRRRAHGSRGRGRVVAPGQGGPPCRAVAAVVGARSSGALAVGLPLWPLHH